MPKRRGKEGDQERQEYAFITVVSENSLVPSYSSQQVSIEFRSIFGSWVLTQLGLTQILESLAPSNKLQMILVISLYGSIGNHFCVNLFKTTLSIRIFTVKIVDNIELLP